VKGIGKGLVGAVAQPVSGGLDLFSSAFEGLDASKDQLLGKPRASILLRRKRLPRVIGGDGKLQPFVRNGTERQVCVAWPSCDCGGRIVMCSVLHALAEKLASSTHQKQP